MALVVCVGGHIKLELGDKMGRKTEEIPAKVTNNRLKRISVTAA